MYDRTDKNIPKNYSNQDTIEIPSRGRPKKKEHRMPTIDMYHQNHFPYSQNMGNDENETLIHDPLRQMQPFNQSNNNPNYNYYYEMTADQNPNYTNSYYQPENNYSEQSNPYGNSINPKLLNMETDPQEDQNLNLDDFYLDRDNRNQEDVIQNEGVDCPGADQQKNINRDINYNNSYATNQQTYAPNSMVYHPNSSEEQRNYNMSNNLNSQQNIEVGNMQNYGFSGNNFQDLSKINSQNNQNMERLNYKQINDGISRVLSEKIPINHERTHIIKNSYGYPILPHPKREQIKLRNMNTSSKMGRMMPNQFVEDHFMSTSPWSNRKKRKSNPLLWQYMQNNQGFRPGMIHPSKYSSLDYVMSANEKNQKMFLGTLKRSHNMNEQIVTNYTVLPLFLNSTSYYDGQVQHTEFEKIAKAFLDKTSVLNFENVTVQQLKIIMKEFGLNHTGKKVELIERLKNSILLLKRKLMEHANIAKGDLDSERQIRVGNLIAQSSSVLNRPTPAEISPMKTETDEKMENYFENSGEHKDGHYDFLFF